MLFYFPGLTSLWKKCDWASLSLRVLLSKNQCFVLLFLLHLQKYLKWHLSTCVLEASLVRVALILVRMGINTGSLALLLKDLIYLDPGGVRVWVVLNAPRVILTWSQGWEPLNATLGSVLWITGFQIKFEHWRSAFEDQYSPSGHTCTVLWLE